MAFKIRCKDREITQLIRILTAVYLLLLIRSIKSEGERNFKGIVKESPTLERVHFKRVLLRPCSLEHNSFNPSHP